MTLAAGYEEFLEIVQKAPPSEVGMTFYIFSCESQEEEEGLVGQKEQKVSYLKAIGGCSNGRRESSLRKAMLMLPLICALFWLVVLKKDMDKGV